VLTWQVTWANQRWTRGIFWLDDVNESSVDTWHASIGCEGATWPNHGLPRGTPGLANEGYVKSFWGPGDSNPDLLHTAPSCKVSDQRATVFLVMKWGLFVFKVELLFKRWGGRAGA
jgi:hypothetical protein